MIRAQRVAEEILVRTALLAGLWWVLAGGRSGVWPAGVPAVAAAVAASFVLPGPVGWRFRPLGVLRFLPFFLKTSLSAGIDVARRALSPGPPLGPGLVEYQWRELPPGPGRVFLANTVSLLPGTLSIGFDRRKLTIHALDCGQDIRGDVGKLEIMVAAMFRQESEGD